MGIQGGSETILIVDDDTSILDSFRPMLSSLGYTVLTSEDGSSATQTLTDQMESIDLVLMDLSLPDLDGRKLAESFREKGFSAPILLVSGYHLEREDVPESINGIVMKPFRIAALAELIRSHLD